MKGRAGVGEVALSAHEYDAAGSYYVTLSCPPDDTAENLATLRQVLAEVQRDGLTAEELTQAKNKITSRLVRGYERPRGRIWTPAAQAVVWPVKVWPVSGAPCLARIAPATRSL